jgi:pyruvyltransferase
MKLGHKCPEVYGDPGILMPLIYQPDNVEKTHDYMVIPQYTSENEVRKYIPGDMIISMNTNDYKSVIDKIVSSKKVYSSSLHGIILAEAYGVPAVFFRGIHPIIDFKYKDYYASTGRYDVPMACSLAEAFSLDAPELPDLTKLQRNLIDTFPYDLWED